MLWKKESNRKTAMYVNYYDEFGTDLADLDEQLSRSKPIIKSDAISDMLREEGNIEFASRNWTNAIEAYNYALCFAENDSEPLSQAYANRSACFFELDQFDSCRTDIELALQVSKCSDTLKQMILQHQSDCADFLDITDPIETIVHAPKLDFEPNESFPTIANVLQIERHKKLGNRTTAKSDIHIGQRIFLEKSMVSTLIDDKYMRCNVCLSQNNNLIPCGQRNCTKAMFCSSECQNSNLHAAECGMANEIEGDGKLAFLIRTILYAVSLFNDANDLMQFVEKSVRKQNDVPMSMTDARSKYKYFLKLKADQKIVSGEKRDPLIYIAYQAILKSKVSDWFAVKKQKRFLIHLIWQHEAIISFGCVHQYINEDGNTSLHIFPTFGQFNHSSTPNAMLNVANNWSTVTTIRPIKEGEEVTISYFNQDTNTDSTVKQQEESGDLVD